jgi:CrcB protein
MTILYLVIGGAAGTVCRHYMSLWVANAADSRPFGTFAVNIVGSFVIGVFLTLAAERDSWPAAVVMLVAVGFLGGFTTFSALAWQTLQQLESGDIGAAAMNIGASVAVGLLAVWAGATVARAAS